MYIKYDDLAITYASFKNSTTTFLAYHELITLRAMMVRNTKTCFMSLPIKRFP